ncbi:MAG: hypothetical protein SEPTF4163_005040 [Sporothrix epigloea]
MAASKTTFGNPDLLRHALNDLHSLHQGPDEDYSTFIAESERLALEALERAINQYLFRKLMKQEVPTEYHELSALLQTIDKYQIRAERWTPPNGTVPKSRVVGLLPLRHPVVATATHHRHRGAHRGTGCRSGRSPTTLD